MDGNGSRTPQTRSRVSLTPGQQRTRRRFETLIGFSAPFLDIVLAVGDRISRIAEPQDYEYYPVRAGELSEEQASQRGPTRPSGD